MPQALALRLEMRVRAFKARLPDAPRRAIALWLEMRGVVRDRLGPFGIGRSRTTEGHRRRGEGQALALRLEMRVRAFKARLPDSLWRALALVSQAHA